MKNCPTCHNERAIMHPTYGITAGKNCLAKSKRGEAVYHRDGLTEYEALKLEWGRNNSEWERNIRSRKVVGGQTFYQTKRGEVRPLPSQPRSRWDNR